MSMTSPDTDTTIFTPFDLPNGVRLKHRLIKSAMSDSLGDGRGDPTTPQMRLYERWALGGIAASIIGEVQGDPCFPEKPGNLMLDGSSDTEAFVELARHGGADGCQLCAQLGQAGVLGHAPIGTPKGPSVLNTPELRCEAMTSAEIRALPERFAETAKMAQDLDFGGVQIHAAYGFILGQFLSPLFNNRSDAYGGTIAARMRLLIGTIEAVRTAVSRCFVVALKLNSSDQLDGGLTEPDALEVVRALDGSGLDLVDVSGDTYFPGTPSISDRSTNGAYYLEFAKAARKVTDILLMATGGFKRRREAGEAVGAGIIDAVGLTRKR